MVLVDTTLFFTYLPIPKFIKQNDMANAIPNLIMHFKLFIRTNFFLDLVTSL